MTTDATGLDLIALPRLGATGVSALLGRMIAQAAAQKKLPAALKQRIELLDGAKTALTGALAKRKGKVSSDDPKAVEADADEDQAVGALVTFLQAHAKRAGDAGKSAQRVLDAVFSDGTKFLNFRHEDEWGEVEARLQKIDDEGHAEVIAKLGGQGFLDDVRAVHEVYGEVLGITVARTSKDAAPDIRGAQNEAANQLRRYVAAIIGYGANSDIDPAVGEVATALMLPIHEARARNASRGKNGPANEGDGEGDEGDDDGDGEPEGGAAPTK